MEVIRTWEDLPYHITLLKEVASIRFNEDCYNTLTLNEAILMSDIIRGIVESSDHYVLMSDSIEIYNAISNHDVRMFNETVEQFTERKTNRHHLHNIGLVSTPLCEMESWYCSTIAARLFNL